MNVRLHCILYNCTQHENTWCKNIKVCEISKKCTGKHVRMQMYKNYMYELHGTGGATRAPIAQTLQTVRQTCPRTTATCPYPFARFPSCGIFAPTRTLPVKQRVETTDTSRTTNYELHGKGWTITRNSFSITTKSVAVV